MLNLSVIIVSWNVRDLLRQCLSSVISNQYSVASIQTSRSLKTDDWSLNTEIILVDNASADGTVEMLRAEFPDVRVIANTENAGFTRGNNQALAVAQGRYLFLLNPDTELRPGALQTLIDYMDTHPRVGIVGPQLFYGDGMPQSSRRLRRPSGRGVYMQLPRSQELRTPT